MKINNIVTILFIIVSSFLVTCQNKDDKVELTPEMAEFLAMLKGSSDDVTLALTKFGATDKIKEDDMGLYDLKDPAVTAQKENCYSVEFTSYITIRMYDICWKDGKITSIYDKGIR